MQNAELVAKSEDLNLKCRLRNEAKTAANNAEKTRAGENRRKRLNTPLYQPDPNLRERHSTAHPTAEFSSAAPTFFLPGSIDNSAGTVTLIADTILGPTSGASGNGVLAHIDFRAIAGGSSSVAPTNFLFLDPSNNSIAISVEAATVEVVASSVPEPSTLLLTATSLLGILAVRKFGRKKEEAISTGKHSN